MAPRSWWNAAATTALLLTLLCGTADGFYSHEYGTPAPSLLALARPLPPETHQNPRDRWLCPDQWSPDGRWLLDYGFPTEEFEVRSRDGSRTLTRDLQKRRRHWMSASDPVWAPDSRSWVAVLGGERSLYAVRWSLEQEGQVLEVPIGFPKWTVMFPDLMQSDLLGFVAKDRVLARPSQDGWPRNGQRRRVPFYEFNVGGGAANVREYNIALPWGIDNGEAALSPNGEWLAWLLDEAPEGGRDAFRLRSVQLAVSRTDGTEMRVLGVLTRQEIGAERNVPRGILWSPDGREIRFRYLQLWWAAPAPEWLAAR